VHSGELLQGLLDDLFRFAQMGAGAGKPQYGSAGVEQLVEEAARLHGGAAPKVDAAGAPSSLCVDLPRLARALANLLDNAAKFSPADSPPKLKIRETKIELNGREEPGLSIAVLDRGVGVGAKDRERIFAPFEQGGDQLTAKPSGIGLGLYEARAIVRQHGGDLEYRPRKGGGSEFRISIPLEPPVREQAVEQASA
jgi:signal transduction histidine kinase